MKAVQIMILALFMTAAVAGAEEAQHPLRGVPIPETSTVVIVAEGEMEPRSIGSYSLRTYNVRDHDFPYDNFVTGIVRPRDGKVEDVRFSDIDGDGSLDIVVIMRSSGTGGYLSADAFRFRDNSLRLLGSVSGLARDGDPVRGLTEEFNTVNEPSAAHIREMTWKWSAFTEAGSAARETVPNPENYTLTFDPSGKVNIRADCNMVLGIYTLEAPSLAINTLGPSTMAFCGEESLDRKFLGKLGQIERYGIENGMLMLHLRDGAGSMIMRKEM